MEAEFIGALVGVTFLVILVAIPKKGPKRSSTKEHNTPRTKRRSQSHSALPRQQSDTAKPKPTSPLPSTLIEGKCHVIDGDTIVIKGTHIRLFGIDAPELNHPYGQKSKWAMVRLCKGQTIRAEVLANDVHNRVVAKCFLSDGRDLSAELVKEGLAIDWPKFSGGLYRALEPAGTRKRLWRAAARQRGKMVD